MRNLLEETRHKKTKKPINLDWYLGPCEHGLCGLCLYFFNDAGVDGVQTHIYTTAGDVGWKTLKN